MRGKNVISASLILALFMSFAMVNIGFSPAPPTIRLSPDNPVADPGETFTLEVIVENAPAISGWEFKVGWDLTVLQFPPEISETTFLNYELFTTDFKIFEAMPYNYVQVGSVLKDDVTQYGLDPWEIQNFGNGAIATITFTVLVGGVSTITIYDVKLIDYDNANIIYTLSPFVASFSTAKPFIDFTWTPENPDIDEVVTFDASASHSPVEGRTIDLYTWDFGDGTLQVEETDPIAEHSFAAYQSSPYMISLTVTDSEEASSSLVKPLRIWPDIGVVDLWNDESTNLDKSSYVMRRDFDLSLILVTVANLGTIEENVDITLTVTNDVTGEEGVIIPLWENPYTMVGGQNSDWDIMALWFGPVYDCPLSAGYYTMTATVVASTDLVPENNAKSINIRLLGADLVGKRVTNHAFSIAIHGDTLGLYGKIKNTQKDYEPKGGITGLVHFEIETPLGETIVLETNAQHLNNTEVSSELSTTLGPLNPLTDVGTYYALAYCRYAADGGLTLDEELMYLDWVGAGLTISEKQSTFSFRVKA